MFILDNQLTLMIFFFLLGCVGTASLFTRPAGHRVWRLADLVWVVLGGIGALVAIIAGFYTADSSRLDRQIDIAYAATTSFDRDAARFRLRFCDPAYDADIAILCDKVEFLSASTASNAELPLFLNVTREVAPLSSLSLWRRHMPISDMKDHIESFEIEQFLVFNSRDEPTQAAVTELRRKVPTIAGDFLILAQSYDALIAQVARLKQEWEHLQAARHILVLQILALCIVSFAAPFRLGKSLVELRAGWR